MNPEQDNFGSLRRLLALKRYEQPHPRYFHEFSAHVIARIESGETGADGISLFEWLLAPTAWVQRFLESIESKPLLAGACGFAFCGFLAAGVLYADKAPSGSVVAVTSPLQTSLDGSAMPVGFVNTNRPFPASGASASLIEEYRKPIGIPQPQLLLYKP